MRRKTPEGGSCYQPSREHVTTHTHQRRDTQSDCVSTFNFTILLKIDMHVRVTCSCRSSAAAHVWPPTSTQTPITRTNMHDIMALEKVILDSSETCCSTKQRKLFIKASNSLKSSNTNSLWCQGDIRRRLLENLLLELLPTTESLSALSLLLQDANSTRLREN